MKEKVSKVVQCISCGACINFCPVYHNLGNHYGGTYLGSKGIVLSAFMNNASQADGLSRSKESGSFNCTLCGNCEENCPMRIPLSQYVRFIREKQEINQLQTDQNKEMIEKTMKEGNPFGKETGNEIPDKLYCC